MRAEIEGAAWHPSPNFNERRGEARVSLVVIHYTAMESAEAALDRLCDPEFEVSAHYLIGADGWLWQLVSEDHRAWHAGAGSWGGLGDVNSRSIGIELDNPSQAPYPEPQILRLETLLAGLLKRHELPPEAVIGHSDLAPNRKQDPGRHFPWRRLAEAGLAVWPAPKATPGTSNEQRFKEAAGRFGYAETELGQLLDAVRQRFRPEASGPLAPEDMAVMADLAHRFPVDRGTAKS